MKGIGDGGPNCVILEGGPGPLSVRILMSSTIDPALKITFWEAGLNVVPQTEAEGNNSWLISLYSSRVRDIYQALCGGRVQSQLAGCPTSIFLGLGLVNSCTNPGA